ncbi:MAG: chemotaxis protein CheA [Actinobacteria bacterium]|nr:chemotaxis protein CheA [Actinomycetota bacterium]
MQKSGGKAGELSKLMDSLAARVADIEPDDREELRDISSELEALLGHPYLPASAAAYVRLCMDAISDMCDGELGFTEAYSELSTAVEGVLACINTPGEGPQRRETRPGAANLEYMEMLVGVFCEIVKEMEDRDDHLISFCANSLQKLRELPSLDDELDEALERIDTLITRLGRKNSNFEATHGKLRDEVLHIEEMMQDLKASSKVPAASEGIPEEDDPPAWRGDGRPGDEAPELILDLEELNDFLVEAPEFLQAAESALLFLEKNPEDSELLNDAFRGFHNIKGSAVFLNLKEVVELSHAAESVLSDARDGITRLSSPQITLILEAVDMLREIFGGLAGKPSGDEYVPPGDLRGILEKLGAGKTRDQAATSVQDTTGEDLTAQAAASRFRRREGEGSEPFVKVYTARLDNLVDAVGELVVTHSIVMQEVGLLAGKHDTRLAQSLSQLTKITRELQETAMSMRMVSLKSTFHKMYRLARDLSVKSRLEFAFTYCGEETEIDRNVVEELNPPLVHLVRNAVDHGIEPPHVRRACGKPEMGHIKLSGCQEGGNVVIELEDDGRGFDLEDILHRARLMGLVDEGERPSDEAIQGLVFHEGFSTARDLTDISGRGVGLGVVRKAVERLHGRLEISTAAGKGTKFTIRLPLTLAIIDGMVVKVADEFFVVPCISIVESLALSDDQLVTALGKGEAVYMRDEVIPIFRLHRLFAIEDAEEDPTHALMLVLGENGKRCALMVDDIVGQQQVVIKTLGPVFSSLKGISGGAIMGSGNVALILDPAGIINMAHQEH